jgi:aspartate aminotransferase
MLENLRPKPADSILQLVKLFREDPRDQKVDLGVGVYRTAQGVTPIMRAVKTAEKQLWEAETTKAYTGLTGDPAYSDAMRNLILGDDFGADRVAAAATPGGTGAIHLGLELIKAASPDATVWMSMPTWPNHPSIAKHLGMKIAEYRYFDNATRDVDFAGMLQDLAKAKAGDAVLLHGCCHNPTGANLTLDQWNDVIGVLERTGAIPFIDIAYQGFGDGLAEDAAATKLVASRLPETLIAASCSKNFGIYRERTGVLMAVCENAKAQPVTQGMLAYLNRQNFSFPPDHGARLVTMIMNDEKLRADWQQELEDVRLGMLTIREQLATELRQRTNSDRFDFIARHRGMFSRIGATRDQVMEMREKNAIYMVEDSRLNIAGLNAKSVPLLAEAIVATGV